MEKDDLVQATAETTLAPNGQLHAVQSRFTSAPWSVGEFKDGIIQILHSDDAPGAMSSPLAKVVNRKTWSMEAEANAYLIAAAPELYEAAAIFEEAFRHNLERFPTELSAEPDDVIGTLDITVGEMRKVCAAMAKARGE